MSEIIEAGFQHNSALENHIYFYSLVDSNTCLALGHQIRVLDAKLQVSKQLNRQEVETPIWLHIQSGGGDIYSAFAIADQIKATKTPVYSIVEGLAASGATIISMACDTRYITPLSGMLIHQLSSGIWGKYEEIADCKYRLDAAMSNLIKFYKANSSMSTKQIKDFLKRDSWFNAEECLKHGLADAFLPA